VASIAGLPTRWLRLKNSFVFVQRKYIDIIHLTSNHASDKNSNYDQISAISSLESGFGKYKKQSNIGSILIYTKKNWFREHCTHLQSLILKAARRHPEWFML
jgi:hypothetical protein